MWSISNDLAGDFATLELLDTKHCKDLQEAVEDGELYKLWYTSVPTKDNLKSEILRRLALRKAEKMLPFAVIQNSSQKAVGMTTFMNIDAENKRLEIGSTWYQKSVQRTNINTECKLLLLSQAFDCLNCVAVEFRTHIMNVKSRKAIERLGAKLDGILRSHMVMSNGTLRDTAVYSIIQSEWPSIRADLKYKLNNFG